MTQWIEQNLPEMGDTGSIPGLELWRRKQQPTEMGPGKLYGQSELAG